MQWFLRTLVLSAVFLVTFFAFGQELMPDTSPVSAGELENFTSGVRGLQGASLFMLTLIAVQVLYFLFRTIFSGTTGLTKLLCLAILSVLATIGANIMSGKTVIESVFLDSATLMAYQVLFHQIKRQWEKREEDRKSDSGGSSSGVRVEHIKE